MPKRMHNNDHTLGSIELKNRNTLCSIIAELLCGRSQQSGIPWVSKSGNLSMPEILVVTSAYARPLARPSVQTLREGEESPNATRRGWRMPSFLGRKSHSAFGQPVFFLAGNRMTTVAFEKEVSLKTIVRQC